MNRHFLALLLAMLFPSFARSGDPEWADAKLAREAPQTLRTVKRFTIGGVGESGYPAQAEFSFRALLKRPDAVAECQKLIADATPAGQVELVAVAGSVDRPWPHAAYWELVPEAVENAGLRDEGGLDRWVSETVQRSLGHCKCNARPGDPTVSVVKCL